jgi:hypothetical protein
MHVFFVTLSDESIRTYVNLSHGHSRSLVEGIAAFTVEPHDAAYQDGTPAHNIPVTQDEMQLVIDTILFV